MFGSLQCERMCNGAAILVNFELLDTYHNAGTSSPGRIVAVQLEVPNPGDDFSSVQLQGGPKECYQALLQILSHAASAHSNDTWKDARQDAAVWQIHDQVCPCNHIDFEHSPVHSQPDQATCCKLVMCKFWSRIWEPMLKLWCCRNSNII